MPPSLSDRTALQFERDGAEYFAQAIDAQSLTQVIDALAHFPADKPGIRLTHVPGLEKPMTGSLAAIAGRFLPGPLRAVRAVLFDKTETTNWALGWHQDRTIVVNRRADVEDYGPWSTKAGLQHVEPPFEVIGRMVTLRLHLDDVGAGNAPLLIAPGSHRLGRITEDRISEAVQRSGVVACMAEAGDVWLYSTPVLHASEAAGSPTRRRVLQIDYADFDLPVPLEWLGV